ncbi:MAG TPA: hypothetical protein VJ765_10940 [Chitinophagaceae bacterium]|nr:hypothetical protein [Chitinophagaceae bacterium]
MEVHDQPITIGSHIWQFTILFLAVLAGFMAENQWEHFVKHRIVSYNQKNKAICLLEYCKVSF